VTRLDMSLRAPPAGLRNGLGHEDATTSDQLFRFSRSPIGHSVGNAGACQGEKRG